MACTYGACKLIFLMELLCYNCGYALCGHDPTYANLSLRLLTIICNTPPPPPPLDIHPGDQILFPESQSKQFQNFIIRANRYPSLVIGGGGMSERGVASNSNKKKVVVVEVHDNNLCCSW